MPSHHLLPEQQHHHQQQPVEAGTNNTSMLEQQQQQGLQDNREAEERALLERERLEEAAHNDADPNNNGHGGNGDDDDERLLLDEEVDDFMEEDIEQQREQQQQLLLMNPDDPSRMTLTPEERQWALDIKAAIEGGGAPDIDPVSDLMYAQLALLEQDNVQAAVDRARAVQELRQEYGILDTLDDGRHYLPGIIDLCPGVYLSYSFNSRDGNYAVVLDIANFDMASIATPDRVTKWLKGGYYLFHVLNPDLAAIRKGVLFLYEAQGYDWKKSMDTHAFRKVWTELGATYPSGYHQIKYFHTGMFLNLLMSMGRRFLPPRIHSKIQVGCQFDGRLDRIYQVPSVEIANQRIKHRFEQSLQKRYENERNFTLETAAAAAATPPADQQRHHVPAPADQQHEPSNN